MSKPRKSIKPSSRYFHSSGTAISANICPAASSITTMDGSGLSADRATDAAVGIPIALSPNIAMLAAITCHSALKLRAHAHHTSKVTAEAQVPGPGRRRPRPHIVAISQAARLLVWDGMGLTGALVAFTCARRIGVAAGMSRALFRLFDGVQVYHSVCIVQRSRDHIRSAGPLA